VASALFARRSKEFAIRMTLGAEPRQVMGMVVASGVRLALCGLVLGLAVGIPIAKVIASKVPDFAPWSIPALGISSAVVLIAAIAAAAQPAARVLRIQPAEIVRSE
jgi:ABC-type antimicrobial peptide transport system permease subunit